MQFSICDFCGCRFCLLFIYVFLFAAAFFRLWASVCLFSLAYADVKHRCSRHLWSKESNSLALFLSRPHYLFPRPIIMFFCIQSAIPKAAQAEAEASVINTARQTPHKQGKAKINGEEAATKDFSHFNRNVLASCWWTSTWCPLWWLWLPCIWLQGVSLAAFSPLLIKSSLVLARSLKNYSHFNQKLLCANSACQSVFSKFQCCSTSSDRFVCSSSIVVWLFAICGGGSSSLNPCSVVCVAARDFENPFPHIDFHSVEYLTDLCLSMQCRHSADQQNNKILCYVICSAFGSYLHWIATFPSYHMAHSSGVQIPTPDPDSWLHFCNCEIFLPHWLRGRIKPCYIDMEMEMKAWG